MTALAPSDAQDAAQRAAGRGGSAVTGPAPALAARPSRTPVSAEFTGRARALLGRFQAYERVYRDSLQAAFEPLKRRLRQGHKVQRTEDLAACERQLDSMPKLGLLHAERDFNRSRRTLDIWQLRIATGSFGKFSWTAPHNEPALLVIAITVSAAKGHCALHVDVLVCVCLHALARWFQRSLAPDEASLFADLADVALHYDVLRESANPQAYKWRHATSNGVWVGEAINAESRVMLSADSFLGIDFS
jgi:hypothetical protein